MFQKSAQHVQKRTAGEQKNTQRRSGAVQAAKQRLQSERVYQKPAGHHHQSQSEALEPSAAKIGGLDDVPPDRDVRNSGHQDVDMIRTKHHVADFIAEIKGRRFHSKVNTRCGKRGKSKPSHRKVRLFEDVPFEQRRSIPKRSNSNGTSAAVGHFINTSRWCRRKVDNIGRAEGTKPWTNSSPGSSRSSKTKS